MPRAKRKRKKKENVPVLPSVRLYRRIAAAFLMLTVILLVVVMYLATVKATIIVETQEEEIKQDFVARIMEEPQTTEDIPGAIFHEVVERSRIFTVEGESSSIPAKAHGMVTLYNTSSRAQPLVATTRLLSKEGVLFRLDEGTTVPAKGDITVKATADEPGINGEVAPGKFTIPGLNQTRQKEVYAKTTQKMVGGTENKKVLTVEDLEKAQKELLDSIEKEEDIKWREGLTGSLDGVVIIKDTLEKLSDTEPGQEASDFSVSTTVEITGIYYNRTRLNQIAELKLKEQIKDGKILAETNKEEMIITYNRSSLEDKTAHLDISVNGTLVLRTTAEILSKTNLIGLTAQEAEAFLESNETIQNATIKITPSWVRHIPKLKDHIEIKIEQ